MIQDQEIWKLMARCIFDEAAPEEVGALKRFLADHPDYQQQYDILYQTLRPKQEYVSDNVLQADIIKNIIEKGNSVYNRKSVWAVIYKKYLPYAAAVLLLITLSVFLLRQATPAQLAHQTPAFATSNGMRKQITLADGTKVWLNAGTKLYYSNDFKGATREVILQGEAFFDVVKNAAKPFIVYAGSTKIKVLGTSFNVKAYGQEKTVETTLYHGLVNITKTDDNTFQPIMLYPNQKIIVPATELAEPEQMQETANAVVKKSIIVQQIDSTQTEPFRMETAWMYNRLEFREENFIDLAQKLERWYNVKIVFEDNEIKHLSFTGSFEKEDIRQAMLALSTAHSFNFKITDNEVIISSKK